MGWRIRVDGWSIVLPEGMTGGRLEHTHAYLRTMAQFRGVLGDGSDLEVIVTTYPGDPIGEHGERLDEGGDIWAVPGAWIASRRSQVTQLDSDPDVPPVETVIVVATSDSDGSVCLVIHRPLGASISWSEAVARSLALSPA